MYNKLHRDKKRKWKIRKHGMGFVNVRQKKSSSQDPTLTVCDPFLYTFYTNYVVKDWTC